MSLAADCGPQPPEVFAQPWQAQVFALVVALHERGLFAWPEWSQTLGEIKARAIESDPGGGDDWAHWVSALEVLVQRHGAADPLSLTALRQAWRVAAEVTPHGRPIELGAAARARARGFGRGG